MMPGPGAPARPSDPTTLDIEERLSVQLNKEGGLEGLEVQGTMSLVVHRCVLLSVGCEAWGVGEGGSSLEGGEGAWL